MSPPPTPHAGQQGRLDAVRDGPDDPMRWPPRRNSLERLFCPLPQTTFHTADSRRRLYPQNLDSRAEDNNPYPDRRSVPVSAH